MSRRSILRRRTYRTKEKWDPTIIPLRFKIYGPFMVDEYAWEIKCLEALEQEVYAELRNKGVPTELDQHYMAFAKRLWERAVDFTSSTLLLEKQSLLNEFTWRGLNPYVLRQLQVIGEIWAERKKEFPWPPASGYDYLFGGIYVREPEGVHGGYYDNR